MTTEFEVFERRILKSTLFTDIIPWILHCSGRAKINALVEKCKDQWQRNINITHSLMKLFLGGREDKDKRRQ
jgi:hypothetical protein